MTPTDALRQVDDLISRVGWCQDASARDVHGRNVPCDHEGAVQFSLDGAVQRATWPGRLSDPDDPKLDQVMVEVMYRLAHAAGMNGDDANPWGYLMDWNDALGRTKEQVAELVRGCLMEGNNA